MSDRNHNPSGISNKEDDTKPPSGASVSGFQQGQQQQSRIPRLTAGYMTPDRIMADPTPPSGTSTTGSQQRQQQQSRIPRPTTRFTTPARLRAVAGRRLRPTRGDTQQASEEPGWDIVDRAEAPGGSKGKATDMAAKDCEVENVGENWEFVKQAEVSWAQEEKDAGKQTEGEDEKVSER